MPGFARIRMIDTDSISAGGYADFKQAEEIDLVLKKIVIVEASGASVENVTFTLFVGDKPLVYPNVSAAVFAPDSKANPDMNVEVKAGTYVSGRVTNNTGSAVRLYIHLIYEYP